MMTSNCLRSYQICVIFAILFNGVASDSSASSPHISKEDLGSQSLVSSFLDEGLMGRIENDLLPLCAKEGDEDNVGGTQLSCSQVKYLAEVLVYHRQFKPKQGKENFVRKAPTVLDKTKDSGADTLPYADLFEDLIVKQVAFKGTMESSELAFEIPSCEEAKVNTATFDKSLNECESDNSRSVVVPMIAVNSYFHKMPTNLAGYSSAHFGLNFGSHWPAIVDIGRDGSMPALSCPLGGHMVIWNPSPSPVNVHLVHATDGSKLEKSIGGQYQDNSYLHFPLFSHVRGSDRGINPAEVLLNKNEYLFAPNNVLVSFPGAKGIENERRQTVLRSCFIDASNLNYFRQSLSAPAYLYKDAAILQQFVDDVAFNVTMETSPKDTSLEEIEDLRIRMVSKNTQAESEKPGDEDVAGENNAAANVRPESKGGSRSRRDRKARKTNIKDWVDSKKWRSLVEKLTIPPATAPVTTSTRFRIVTIEWASPFLPRKGDVTKFAFELTFCNSRTSVDSTENPCVVIPLRLDSSSLEKRVEGRVTAEDEGKTLFSYSFSKLSPGTMYHYRLGYSYGDMKAKATGWISIKTLDLAVPSKTPEMPFKVAPAEEACTAIRLSIPAVNQDGDSDVEGYYVFSRMVSIIDHKTSQDPKAMQGSRQTYDWVFHDKVLVKSSERPKRDEGRTYNYEEVYHNILVSGLMPNAFHELKVTPFNEVGQAESLSHTTEPIEIVCNNRKSPASIVYAGAKTENNEEAFLLTLNDTAQTISCSDNDRLFVNAWSSHWSPKSFTLIGESIFVQPLLLETELVNPESVINKIAMVGRGSIPLANKIMKLQKAGAKGVLVLDSGECTAYDQVCMPGAEKTRGEGWAAADMYESWVSVKIPVLFILRKDQVRLGKCLGHATFKQREEL